MLWLSLVALAVPAAAPAQQPGARHIAVIAADSTILEPGTPFPFTRRSLVFQPSAGGYTMATGPLDFEDQKGERSSAYYAEAIEIPLPFPFRFFGREYRTAYAYMHGVVMFARAEPLDQRLYPAVLARQPPLIAALFHSAQSSPPGAGGADGLYVNALPHRVVITWYRVMPAQVEGILNSFQAILYRDGRIRVAYLDMQDPEGLVGLSTGDLAPNPVEIRLLDHEGTPLSATFYQWFRKPAYDSRAVARAFYHTYPDSFDALAIFENFPVSHPAVSLYVPVKNDVRVIGYDLFDRTAEYGSVGRLQGVLNLNSLELLGPSPSTGMLGHEFAHRWLASAGFLDDGRRSTALVTGSHWCFYVDTRTGRTWRDVPTTSFMFGSLWDELPDGRFRTGRATSLGSHWAAGGAGHGAPTSRGRRGRPVPARDGAGVLPSPLEHRRPCAAEPHRAQVARAAPRRGARERRLCLLLRIRYCRHRVCHRQRCDWAARLVVRDPEGWLGRCGGRSRRVSGSRPAVGRCATRPR